MTNSTKRDIATSLTAILFTITGVTGVLMFFHLFDQYTKQMHEILGLVFFAVVFLHVFVHLNSMKSYFQKKIFIVSFIVFALVSGGFIYKASSNGSKSPKTTIIELVLQSDIESSTKVLGTNMELLKQKLEKNGIKYNEEKSISQIATNNKTSPFRIVDILTK